MARRKMTFVYDPEKAPTWLKDIAKAVAEWPEAWAGVDPSSVTVEDLPDPLFDWDEATTPTEAVFQALGRASACWERLEGAGIFDSDKAKRVGDELLAFLRTRGLPDA